MWFIVFKDYPEDVEVSFKSNIYECYDEIPTKNGGIKPITRK